MHDGDEGSSNPEVKAAEELATTYTDQVYMLGKARTNSGSKAQLVDPFKDTGKEIYTPTADPDLWASQLDKNTRLRQCVHLWARNTVGLGWSIEPINPVTEETEQSMLTLIDRQTEMLSQLFDHPNEKLPTTTLLYLIGMDEGSIGNGWMEITRDDKGDIDGLHHIQGTTIRVRKGEHTDEDGEEWENGFIQIRSRKKTYFKCFGDPSIMASRDGQISKDPEGLPNTDRANELIHFLEYSPSDSFYGIPRHVAAIFAIVGNVLASRRNIAFFDNDCVGRLAILVSGGTLHPKSIDMVEKFLEEGKGPDNAHRVMVLQAEPQPMGPGEAVRTELKVEPLTVGITDDASFLKYRDANNEEVREAWGIAKVYFTTDDVNRASAVASMRITDKQQFEPERIEKEHRINHTIVRDILDGETEVVVEFKLKRPILADDLEESEIDAIRAKFGGLTPNDFAKRSGRPAYNPEEVPFDPDIPLAITIKLLELAARPNTPAPNGNPDEDDDEDDDDEDAGKKRAKDILDQLVEVRSNLISHEKRLKGKGKGRGEHS